MIPTGNPTRTTQTPPNSTITTITQAPGNGNNGQNSIDSESLDCENTLGPDPNATFGFTIEYGHDVCIQLLGFYPLLITELLNSNNSEVSILTDIYIGW
eukprot:CAMPEP_0114643590 /NCGR_PEP_ID=MMETSP0191-20121206/3481_1 /TAXON_ID=126664 /ORGANISM="Sorites sp." /LENGTH=98 /DNA_ID=CAMNT_0001855927 /DNA_START=446 /DNA_END=739 /DNA_ORIENTATION=+